MVRYTAKVPGFGKQYSSVGPYMPQKDMANPLDELMSKAPAGKSTNAAWEDFSIGRTSDDKPRPQVQAHGHGRNEG